MESLSGDTCPCGSGKPRTRCCFGRDNKRETDRADLAWRLIRTCVDGYATGIVRLIGESYGRTTLQEAWREFTVGQSDEFLGVDPHAELFFSWLFHRWAPAPEKGNKIDDHTLYGIPPTRAYLARTSSRIDPLLRRYLEACLIGSHGFYEILDCRPRIGFKARDMLAGADLEVSEDLASTSLRDGDIVFAHIVQIDGIAVLDAVSPLSLPQTFKRHLSEVNRRREVHGHADLALRRLYFTFLELHLSAPAPEIRIAPAPDPTGARSRPLH